MDFTAINAQIEKIGRTFEEFKQANDSRLKLVESKGAAPADYEEKLGRMNKSIDEAIDRVKAIETAHNRPLVPGADIDAKEAQKASRAAFEKMLRKGREALTADEVKLLATDSDPAGGYLVPTEQSAEIQQKVFETTPMRQLATVRTIGTNALEEPADWDEYEVETPGERGTRNETDTSQFSMFRVDVHNIEASPKATQNMLDDAAFNLEAYIAGKIATKISRTENTWFVSGTGVNQARGILAYTAGDGYGLVEQVNSGSAATITGDSLITTQDTLLEPFQPNASWLMRRTTRSVIRKFKDGQGQYLWSIDRTLSGGVQENLLGRPLYLGSDMPALGADALAVAYGDFRAGYTVVDRMGLRTLRNPYKDPGFVTFYTTKRTGGAVRHYQAIKILKCSV